MDWLRQLDVEKFLLFTLVLTRVSGLLMTAPIYGTKDVPDAWSGRCWRSPWRC